MTEQAENTPETKKSPRIIEMSQNGRPLPYPGALNNLKRLDQRPRGELLLISAKGGSSKSIAKSEAAKLNAIKRRISKEIANPEDSQWLLQQLEDRPSMAADLLLYITKLKQEGGVHPSQRVALANVMVQAIKSIHGEKIKTENVNINVNTTVEEWEGRISKTMEEDHGEDNNV